MEDSLAAASEEGGSPGSPTAARARAAKESAPAHPAKRYADAARPERQPRVTDLVPVRPWTLTVLLLGLLSAVAALAGLDGEAAAWSRSVGRANLAALDLSARGSLASWYSSLLLAGAAAASVLVFLLRRHKVDDYRGRYRFWLWAAAVLAMGSVDATAGVHRIFGGLLARLTGTLSAGDGVGWSLLLGGAMFGSLAVRAVFEIRHSRGALAALLLAVAAYITSAGLLAGALPSRFALTVFAGQTAAMLAHVAVLFCVLLSARYVLLDAQGKLPPRTQVRKKRKWKREADETPPEAKAGEAAHGLGRKLRVDKSNQEAAASQPSEAPRKQQPAESKRPQTVAPTTAAKGVTSAVVDDDEELLDEGNASRKLSKAERRRLRKLQRRGERV